MASLDSIKQNTLESKMKVLIAVLWLILLKLFKKEAVEFDKYGVTILTSFWALSTYFSRHPVRDTGITYILEYTYNHKID